MDKFNSYGHGFQIKIISSLLSDKGFLQQVSDILDPEYFESESNQWIVEIVLKYFSQFKSSPTLDVFKLKVQDVERDVLKTAIIESLKDAYRYLESDDLSFVKEETLNFCKNQVIKQAILTSVDLLNKGEYDKIKSTIDSAMKAGADRQIGYEFMVDIRKRYTDNVRNTIPTCWPLINDLAAGGFGKGELIIFVAPPGIGKSTALMNIGAHAVQKKLNVVHYTMELSEEYTAQRYDAIVTGIATQNLKYHLDDVETELTKKVNGQLIIKYYPTKSASVNTLKAHLDQMILLGTKPDLVIIDYADLLRGTSKSREKLHEDLEIIYEELRGMAGEYEIPIFSASQSNRCHWVEDKVSTISGEKRIGDVVEGDMVLTHKGYKKVTRVFPTENQPVYRIKTKSGKIIHISDNHEIPCLYGQLKSINTGLNVGDKIFTKK